MELAEPVLHVTNSAVFAVGYRSHTNEIDLNSFEHARRDDSFEEASRFASSLAVTGLI